jgi:hypothetical protein
VKNSCCCRVGLAQLIRFLVVKLIHSDLNHKFDIVVAFIINYFSVRDDIPVDSEAFLMIDFINLKIKSVQSFEGNHKNKVCMCVHKDKVCVGSISRSS